MITLYQPPAAWGIPSLSPFGTKVETYLRMVGLPYVARLGDPRKAPKGKMPWIEDEGRTICDSSDILDHLEARHGDPLDRDLDAGQRALALLTRRTLEEHLYWCLVYTRWVEPAGLARTREYFLPLLPPVVGGLVFGQIRKGLVAQMHAQGVGRHARDDIYRRGGEDLAAVSVQLGERPYFLGEQPSSVDASLYAFTSGLWMHPADNPLKRRLAALSNLGRVHRADARPLLRRPPAGQLAAELLIGAQEPSVIFLM